MGALLSFFMVMAKIELNKTGRGFHVRGKAGVSPAVLLERTIDLLRGYGIADDRNYHLLLDEKQADIVLANGQGRVPGELYDVDKLRLVDRGVGEHCHVAGARPIASIALLLKTSENTDYGRLRDADYPVRGTTVVTPRVLVFVHGFTVNGQESPIHTGTLQREMVRYGQRMMGL